MCKLQIPRCRECRECHPYRRALPKTAQRPAGNRLPAFVDSSSTWGAKLPTRQFARPSYCFPTTWRLRRSHRHFSGSETETPGPSATVRVPVAPRAVSLPTLAFSGEQGRLVNRALPSGWRMLPSDPAINLVVRSMAPRRGHIPNFGLFSHASSRFQAACVVAGGSAVRHLGT